MMRLLSILVLFGPMVLLAGCTRITTEPNCPPDVGVGETITLRANPKDPGAIPSYLWEVLPAGAGTFDAPDQPVTGFTAGQAGEATIRLSAADGVFLDVTECKITIGDVAVELGFEPDPPVVSEPVTLTCITTGDIDATTFALEQTDGPAVELQLGADGTASFTATQVGDYTFSCVGTSDTGRDSAPSTITVTVGEVSVELSVAPASPTVNEVATLTCSSTGSIDATAFTLEQSAGTTVELTTTAEGVATFTPTEVGDLTFTCVGASDGGVVSDPGTITVTVEQGGRRPPGRG